MSTVATSAMTAVPLRRELWPSLMREVRRLTPGNIEVAETDDVLEYAHFATGICVSMRLDQGCIVVSAVSELLDPASSAALMSDVANHIGLLTARPVERIVADGSEGVGLDHAYAVIGDGGEWPVSTQPVMLTALPMYDRRAPENASSGRRRWFRRGRRRTD